MLLVKVNKTDYVNPEKIIKVCSEKNNSAPENENAKSWYIYTDLGKIKTEEKFNVKAFIRKCR